MQDEIRIENLECFAFHGVNPEENEKGQLFYVNTTLYTDTRKAAQNDDISLTTDYGEVTLFINKFMKANTYKLIETVADKLATAILLNFPLIHKLDLEIRKPHAPINLNFSSVSVKISRGWQRVYVATGSNLGESEKNINNAITQMKENKYIRDVKTSELYRSAPYGMEDQPDYINGAVTFLTLLSPHELLTFLHQLEIKAGRERKKDSSKNARWLARTLDLDIIFYEDLQIDEADLVIPHPDLHKRDFVLIPLINLNRHLKHPTLNRVIVELLDELPERFIKIP